MRKIRRGTRITGRAREKLARRLKRRYDKGESIRQLAEKSGRSYGAVHRLLTEVGVQFRASGVARTVAEDSAPRAEGNPAPLLSRIVL